MSFVVTKIIAAIVTPSSLLFILLIMATIGIATRFRRFFAWILRLTMVVTLTVIVVPVGQWLMVPLEQRFSMPERYPDHVDGVIVLGNGPNGHISAARDEAAISEPGERFAAMVELSQQYPGARLLFSGGSGSIGSVPMTESEAVALYFERLGLDPKRVIFEDRSRNTYENALYSFELAQPLPGERWLLVTSAKDMPRAYGVFKARGFDVEPWLVDFLTTGAFEYHFSFKVAQRLWQLDQAVHEWLGLFVYYQRGWINQLFPGR